MRNSRRACCRSRSCRRRRTRRRPAEAEGRASCGLPTDAADGLEDFARGGAAFIERVAVAFVGAVPLVFEAPREIDESRPPCVLRAQGGDVLPVRASFSVVQ